MTTMNIFDLVDTWGDAAVNFTAIKMNVTNTASAAGSLLLDLQVGGASKFNIDKAGNVNAGAVFGSTYQASGGFQLNNVFQMNGSQNGIVRLTGWGGGSLTIAATPYTVAGLPSAATAAAGARAFVTDANATTYGSIVAGGGSNGVPVFCNGTSWLIG